MDDEGGAIVAGLDGVGLLIGGEEGAVYEDAAVDEVEAPIASALVHAGHVEAGLGRFVGAGKDLRDHFAEGPEELIAGAGRGEAASADAAGNGFLFGSLRWLAGYDGLGARFDSVVFFVGLLDVGFVGVV